MTTNYDGLSPVREFRARFDVTTLFGRDIAKWLDDNVQPDKWQLKSEFIQHDCSHRIRIMFADEIDAMAYKLKFQ